MTISNTMKSLSAKKLRSHVQKLEARKESAVDSSVSTEIGSDTDSESEDSPDECKTQKGVKRVPTWKRFGRALI